MYVVDQADWRECLVVQESNRAILVSYDKLEPVVDELDTLYSAAWFRFGLKLSE